MAYQPRADREDALMTHGDELLRRMVRESRPEYTFLEMSVIYEAAEHLWPRVYRGRFCCLGALFEIEGFDEVWEIISMQEIDYRAGWKLRAIKAVETLDQDRAFLAIARSQVEYRFCFQGGSLKEPLKAPSS